MYSDNSIFIYDKERQMLDKTSPSHFLPPPPFNSFLLFLYYMVYPLTMDCYEKCDVYFSNGRFGKMVVLVVPVELLALSDCGGDGESN